MEIKNHSVNESDTNRWLHPYMFEFDVAYGF